MSEPPSKSNDNESTLVDDALIKRKSVSRVTLEQLKKAGREKKAEREQEMENAVAQLTVSQSDPNESLDELLYGRLPVLKYDEVEPSECGKSVGLVYHNDMLKHRASKTMDYGRKHPERPERILRPLERLNETGVLSKLYLIKGREATVSEISSIHLEDHISAIASLVKLEKEEIEEGQESYDSVYICKHSYNCALLSCGSTLSIVKRVVHGSLKSGFALVRPPGHHAEMHTARGFCIFNNVAVAVKQTQAQAKENNLVSHEKNYRILILDWDVHHGNGTQNMFYDDPSVLYISLHRYEHGFFYPSSEDANHDRVGAKEGLGFNINIPWSDDRMGDAEYYLAFEHIVMPIAEEYKPDLVLVSCGFDAGKGDPLGGFKVTPRMYGYMTHRLQTLADGKVVIVLEGGYNLKTVADSVLACTKALLSFSTEQESGADDTSKDMNTSQYRNPPKMNSPNSSGLKCILNTIESISPYWVCMEKHKTVVEQMIKDEEKAAMDKLSKGFKTLGLENANRNRSDSGHGYGTRAKSRSANHNNANSNATDSTLDYQSEELFKSCSETESDDWEQLEFAPPGSLDVPAPPPAQDSSVVTGRITAPDISMHHETFSDESSYYSTHSEISVCDDDHKKNSFTGQKETGKSTVDEGEGNESLGACGGSTSTTETKPDKEQLTMVLTAFGWNNVDGMSVEDMLAITQAGLPDDASGYTVPKNDCPHVQEFVRPATSRNLDLRQSCTVCGNDIENWSCMLCGQVYCGRFVNAHMLEHNKCTAHTIALSHADLSFWCYGCDSYLNNFTIQPLKEIYKKAHLTKHGTDAPI